MKPKAINNYLFTSIVANAILAGLVPKDQEDVPVEEIEVHGDFASLMQFVELMYEDKEINETLERLEKDFAEKYGDRK
jgi:hypothetical protein